jgi:hypothetical protein
VGFESRLGAVICGVELDTVIYGVELSARSSTTSNRTMKLDAVSHDVKTCNLDVVNYAVDPLGPKAEFTSFRGLNMNFL